MVASHPRENKDEGVEEREPKFKYTRMENDLPDILKADSVSCAAIHSKFICIGTERGTIYVLDHLGNVIRELQVQDVAINQLSIDGNGDHVASCFDDGRVLVTGLYSSIHNQDVNFGRRVGSVAIDPFYYRLGSGRRLIVGERKLILHEKIPFSRWKQTVLEDATAEGGVKMVKWSPAGDLILWASYREFRIYNLISRDSIRLNQFPMESEIDLKCHVCWKGNRNVIVGWGDRVQMYDIKIMSDRQSNASSKCKVELEYDLPIDAILCGVGPLENNIVVFGCENVSSGVTSGGSPLLQVIGPDSEGFVDLGTDLLHLEGFENYTTSQYSLDFLPDEGLFIITCPKDVLIACPYDTDERIDWFLKFRRYQKALDVIEQSRIPPIKHSRMEVGLAFIGHLLECKEYEKAAALCPQMIGADKVAWEELLWKFDNVKQLRMVADFLPTSDESRLAMEYYSLVLNEYLIMDHEGFLTKIKQWPHHLYDKQVLSESTWSYILTSEPKPNPTLLEALAILYCHMEQFDNALCLYAKLQFKCSFELIKQYNLYSKIHKSARDLMKLDSALAVEAMLSTRDAEDHRLIRNALADDDYFLYLYLDALRIRKPKLCFDFHMDLVRLYAEFDRDKLLPLLKNSDHYAIQEALEICEKRKFTEEVVHLLGRMGNTKYALTLIFTEIKDFERAVDFCKEHDDEELWDDLILFSLDKPGHINMLLKSIASYVDPRVLIQRIDVKLEIPMLRDALVKMMRDYLLHVHIHEDHSKIISQDHYGLQCRQLSMRERGFAVRYDNQCGACHNTIMMENLKDGETPGEVTIFNCSHMFHSNCLPIIVYCTICTRNPSCT